MQYTKSLRFLQHLTLWGLCLVVLYPSFLEIIQHELPCPLCLLQRFGLLMVALGFLMNLRFGFKPCHYVVSLLACLFTAMASIRQILLHIVPGSGRYGEPLLGLSLYTWVFWLSVACILWICFLLCFAKQFAIPGMGEAVKMTKGLSVSLGLFLFVVTVNVVSVGLECGLSACPANPVKYLVKNA